MQNLSQKIRKAVVTNCMAEGIDDPDTIVALTVKAIRSIGKMSAAGYKAHATRRRQQRFYR